MPVVTDHWAPTRKAVEYAEQCCLDALDDGKGLVVELGPCNRPFRLATEFIGRDPTQSRNGYNGTFRQVDLSREELPWDDDEVAFVYCRHTIEDLDDPAWCLSEIQRVARAGYIECPSPIAECCRGVDAERASTGKRPPWRGYHHHRSIVWDSNGTLTVMAKLPFIEHVNFGPLDQQMCDTLNGGPLYWNTYFAWRGKLKWHYHQHELDYEIGPGYGKLLDKALLECQESCRRFG